MKPNTIRISVIVPSFNAETTIEATLQSIYAQQWPNFEIVVVDGGSTDGTIGIALSFGPETRVITERDRGQLDAVRKGLAIANGDWIVWINADDLVAPNAFSAVEKIVASDPTIDFVYSDNFAYDEKSKRLYVGQSIRFLTPLHHIIFYKQVYSECVYWKKNLTKSVTWWDFDLRLCTDYAVVLQLEAASSKIKWSKDRLGIFRMREGQISSQNRARIPDERQKIRSALASRFGLSIDDFPAKQKQERVGFWLRSSCYPLLARGLRILVRLVTLDIKRRRVLQYVRMCASARLSINRHH